MGDRKSIRLRGYDYSSDGRYFITVDSWHKRKIFGMIVGGKMVLNQYGKILEEEILNTHIIRHGVNIPVFQIMLDHFHMILEISVGAHGNAPVHIGCEIKLYIHMAVSENDISLYGFEKYEDLDLFKMLITVSGVGSRTAAGILAEKNSLDIIKAIGGADVDFFKKIKGIGLKTAQRIIVDLKSKIGGLGELDLRDNLPLLEDDLVLSLQQLGFERKEIENVTAKLPKDLEKLEEKLEWCLLNLGR